MIWKNNTHKNPAKIMPTFNCLVELQEVPVMAQLSELHGIGMIKASRKIIPGQDDAHGQLPRGAAGGARPGWPNPVEISSLHGIGMITERYDKGLAGLSRLGVYGAVGVHSGSGAWLPKLWAALLMATH